MPKKSDGKLGTFDSVNLLVGGMIGSAIFSLSGITIWRAGPASLVSWILAALILFAYGLQTAELASLYPNSGGVFSFPALSLGKTEQQGTLWGWISAWAYLFGCVAGAAFSAIYVGIYLSVAFPVFAQLQVPIAVLTVLICGALNAMEFRITGKTTTMLTLILALTLLVFSFVLLGSDTWEIQSFVPFFSQGKAGRFGFIETLPIAMVAYGSIVALSFMVGEIRTPNKTVPKAMAIAMGIVVTLYGLVLFSTLGLVSSQYLQENEGLRYIPLFASASKVTAGPFLTKLISLSAVLALYTTIIVTMALAARTLQASSDNGLLSPWFGKTHAKTGSPIHAVLAVTLVTGVLGAIPQLTNFLINLGALCNVIVIAIISLSVLASRKKHPLLDKHRFKAPGGTVLPLLTLLVLFASYIPSILAGGYLLWVFTLIYYCIGMVLYIRRRSIR